MVALFILHLIALEVIMKEKKGNPRKGAGDNSMEHKPVSLPDPAAGRAFLGSLAALAKHTGSVDRAVEAMNSLSRAFGPNTRIIGSYTDEGVTRYVIQKDPGPGLAVVSPAGRGAQDAQTVPELMRLGIDYAEQGNLDSAYAVFTEILRVDPGYVNAYVNRANVCASKGNYKQALADYNEALRLDSVNVHAFMGRAGLHRIKGDLAPALADSNEAVRLDPNFGAAYYTRGTVYHARKDYEHTRADWEQALRLSPGFAFIKERLEALRKEAAREAVTVMNQGDALAAQGEWELALEEYNRAILLNPGDARFYARRGDAYASQSEWKDALANYTKAIRLDPNYVMAYVCRGNVHYERNEPELARANWKQALKLDPKCAAARDALDGLDDDN
jgi:tetratricopeptide (TPR) repeat protein